MRRHATGPSGLPDWLRRPHLSDVLTTAEIAELDELHQMWSAMTCLGILAELYADAKGVDYTDVMLAAGHASWTGRRRGERLPDDLREPALARFAEHRERSWLS